MKKTVVLDKGDFVFKLKKESLDTKYRSKDGMTMVLIPAGEFEMGDETGDLDGSESWLNLP